MSKMCCFPHLALDFTIQSSFLVCSGILLGSCLSSGLIAPSGAGVEVGRSRVGQRES